MAGSSFALLAVLCAATAFAEGPMSEAEYVERVLRSGLEAKVIEAERAVARAEAEGAGTWPNPSLEWERQPNPTDTQVVGGQHVLAASVPLVLSGRLGLEAEAATRGAEASEARLARARAQLRKTATLAFAAVLAAGERRAVLERSLAALGELTRIIEAREKAGEAAGYDRARIELERGMAEDALRASALEERRARTAAQALLGSADAALPAFSGALGRSAPLPSPAELPAGRADLAALALEEEAAQLSARAAQRSLFPEPTVSGGALLLEGADPGHATGVVVGLSVPLPLFERGQGPRARADARRSLAGARRELLLRSARLELDAARVSLSSQRERLERHGRDVLARAEELRTIAAAAYRGGASELLILVDAERAAREAALHTVSLKLELHAAETDVLFLSGAFDEEAQTRSDR